MNDLQIFNYQNNQVRTVENNGEPRFVLKDVCEVLGISNATDVAKRLDNDEVTRFNLGGLSGETNIVNESGLSCRSCSWLPAACKKAEREGEAYFFAPPSKMTCIAVDLIFENILSKEFTLISLPPCYLYLAPLYR